MLIEPCHTIWYCPTCGQINGGVACGGIVRICAWCPQRGICELDADTAWRWDWRLCLHPDCILGQVLRMRGRTHI